jgi:predicted aldo/keto reductase-like oxidoreductase
MIYKEFQNVKLPALGFGAMRLPTIGSEWDSPIDETATEKMFDYAMEHGVNYFDTAWGYHGGQSEVITGKLLGKYPRDSWLLADKFPGYDLSNMDKVEEIFEEQLKKCGVDYFDFYMLHNVCEMNIDAYLDESIGIYDYLMVQKKSDE